MRQDKFDLYIDERPRRSASKYALLFGVAVILLATVVAAALLLFKEKEPTEDIDSAAVGTGSADITFSMDTDSASSSDTSAVSEVENTVRQLLISDSVPENTHTTFGIDVSSHQGNIDWQTVKADGIDFAVIRVGYRTQESGEIKEDTSARYNLQEAAANGVKLGVYFFSTACSEAEALEEAQWVCDFIAQYPITYPVVYDCEGYDTEKSRQFSLTAEERTDFAEIFMNHIYEKGYTPMFYASRNALYADTDWQTSELDRTYKIWISQYTGTAYTEAVKPDYTESYSMWQYRNDGTVSGIDTPVDMNVAYFGYDSVAAPKDSTPPPIAEENPEAGHHFTEVNETVTAKEAVNLRSIPSQGSESQVLYVLNNGQTAVRNGVSSSGWSRLVYNGETVYAVSSFLTTDLSVKKPEPTPQPQPDDGIQTVFTACDDMVSPKIEVNLRNIPSVTNASAAVVATVKYGEVFHRTGINEELGWSRVEYGGQTLYCVTSYIYVYEEPQEE